MRKKTDTPTRNEVTERVEKNKEEMEERVEQLDTIATDSETVRETLDALDFEGTADASDEVEGAIEQAEEVTIEAFENTDENLEEAQSETEDHESELQDRSDSAQMDLGKISDASGQIETQETISDLADVKTANLGEMDFLKDNNQKGVDAREENEQAQQELQNLINSGRRS